MTPSKRIKTKNICLNNEEMSLVLQCVEKIKKSAPYNSSVHLTISKRPSELRGDIEIHSTTGTVDLQVGARDLGGLLEVLPLEATEKLRLHVSKGSTHDQT